MWQIIITAIAATAINLSVVHVIIRGFSEDMSKSALCRAKVAELRLEVRDLRGQLDGVIVARGQNDS